MDGLSEPRRFNSDDLREAFERVWNMEYEHQHDEYLIWLNTVEYNRWRTQGS